MPGLGAVTGADATAARRDPGSVDVVGSPVTPATTGTTGSPSRAVAGTAVAATAVPGVSAGVAGAGVAEGGVAATAVSASATSPVGRDAREEGDVVRSGPSAPRGASLGTSSAKARHASPASAKRAAGSRATALANQASNPAGRVTP